MLIDFELFVNNFTNGSADEVESEILERFHNIVGFRRKYDETIFDLPSAHELHKLSLASHIERTQNKLKLFELIKASSSALLTHNNSEVRKLSKVLVANTKANSVTGAILTYDNQIRQYLAHLLMRDKLELAKLSKNFSGPCIGLNQKQELYIKAGTSISFKDKVINFKQDQLIKAPTFQKGKDYQVLISPKQKIKITTNKALFIDSEDLILVGGFHFAPGGNASDQCIGGSDEEQINPLSIWDLHWRPTCYDPRGMVFVNNEFWCDIYPLTEDGKNTFGKKIKTKIDWWDTNLALAEQGKQCPTEEQFNQLALGSLKDKSNGKSIHKATVVPPFTSKWGVMMSAGCHYMWGNPFKFKKHNNI